MYNSILKKALILTSVMSQKSRYILE